MSIQITFDIVESDQAIAQLMLQEIVKQVNPKIKSRMSIINQQVRMATFTFIQNTDTYNSLVNGELAGHFGIPSANRQETINKIVAGVSNGMQIDFEPINVSGTKFTGGIKFRVLSTNLSEVIDLVEGVVITEKNAQLDWLKWLLTYGDKIIISEYEVQIASGLGRSGRGMMLADNAGVWRVPPQYAGTLKDNWLTRALVGNSKAYLSIIENIIKQELQRIL